MFDLTLPTGCATSCRRSGIRHEDSLNRILDLSRQSYAKALASPTTGDARWRWEAVSVLGAARCATRGTAE